MATIVVCGIGAWPVSFAIGSEASAIRLRAKTQGIGWFAGSLSTGVLSIILPYIFNPDEGNLRGRTGFLYAALCLVALIVAWSVVPEMKGLQAAQIDKLFESTRPVKRLGRPNSEVV